MTDTFNPIPSGSPRVIPDEQTVLLNGQRPIAESLLLAVARYMFEQTYEELLA